MWRFDPRKMAEDGGQWLTWLLGTERCTTNFNLQPAAGGIFRGQRGVESGEGGEGDMYDRCVAFPPAEDRGSWRKLAEDGGECNIYAGLTFYWTRDAPSQKSWESWGGAGLLTRGPLANTIRILGANTSRRVPTTPTVGPFA